MAASIRDRKPAEITRAMAYDLIQQHAGTPVQAGSLRRELGAAWEWAHDAGRLPEDVPNWWRLVMRGKLASKGKIIGGQHQGAEVKRVLSVAEVGAVLRHLPHVSRMIAELLTLYLWTGCRGAEIVAIEGREVSEDAEGWWWTIPRAKLKVRRHPLATDLRVPLVGRALEIVRARMDVHGSGHLYPPTRGPAPHIDQKTIGAAVWWYMPRCQLRPEQIRARWPVKDWASHDLRRTVRTQLAAMGCPQDIAEAVLGHIRPGVVGVYDRHAYDAERREWITLLAAAWEAAAAR
jgi:integrase